MFGGSAATTLFGSRGAGNFLTKLTTGSAVVFMITSFYLAYVAVIADQGDVLGAPAASEAAPSPSDPQQAPPVGGDYGEVMTEGAPAEPAQPAAESAPEPATNPQATPPASDSAQ